MISYQSWEKTRQPRSNTSLPFAVQNVETANGRE